MCRSYPVLFDICLFDKHSEQETVICRVFVYMILRCSHQNVHLMAIFHIAFFLTVKAFMLLGAESGNQANGLDVHWRLFVHWSYFKFELRSYTVQQCLPFMFTIMESCVTK